MIEPAPPTRLWRLGLAAVAVQGLLGIVVATVWRDPRVLGATAVLALVTAAFFALAEHRLRRRLEYVTTAAARLRDGDLASRLQPAHAGALSGLAGALNEMADRLSARIARLEAQQAAQHAILQMMSNGVIALDTDQRIMNINQAAEQLLGIRSEQSIGRMIQEVTRQPEMHRFVSAALAGEITGAQEITLEGKNPITVQAAGEQIADVDGALQGVLIILNDVTRLRRLEALRSDFAANVSHELRTPITNIKGYVETLLELGWDDRARAAQFLDIINKNSSRLASIVEDVMALTKLEQPHATERLEREPTLVSRIFSIVTSQFEPAAAAKGIRLATAGETDLEISVHPQMIEQALGNLVDNAIAYSPPHTTVTLSARHTERTVDLAVTDEGPGILEEHLPRLFERFYRVDKARSREVGGTGLGLAIVKHIAIMHGGQAEVESHLGGGSTFRLVLPANRTLRARRNVPRP